MPTLILTQPEIRELLPVTRAILDASEIGEILIGTCD